MPAISLSRWQVERARERLDKGQPITEAERLVMVGEGIDLKSSGGYDAGFIVIVNDQGNTNAGD